jgi:aspartate/tyrosine/aromatic aminotransferase
MQPTLDLRVVIKMIVLQSFTRNMGLYGERPAVLHFVCSGQEEKDRVLSQIGPMVRASYLTASIHGARIAYRILNNKEHL